MLTNGDFEPCFLALELLVAVSMKCYSVGLLKLIPKTPAAPFKPKVPEAVGSEERIG